jgi:hypothetical protein
MTNTTAPMRPPWKPWRRAATATVGRPVWALVVAGGTTLRHARATPAGAGSRMVESGAPGAAR